MTARITQSDLPPDQRVEHLLQVIQNMQHSLQQLASYQKSLLQLSATNCLEESLDTVESLLDEAIEFQFMRLYLRSSDGAFEMHREMCPESLKPDWSIIEWTCQKQELSIMPLTEEQKDDEIQSLLLLPLVSHSRTTGILELWVNQDPSQITQQQTTLLTMLSHETGNVLETYRYRERIEQAHAQTASIMESVPQGIFAMDREGMLTSINRTMEIMLDIRRADVLGAAYQEVLPPAVGSLLAQQINGEASADEQEIRLDYQGREETYGISCSALLLAPDEPPAGYVVVCRDLKLSQELQKLRELDAMKNDFLSLVSHELRTPLTSIMAYAETLLMEGMVDTEEERKEYLEIIYEEGARLSRLINDVLDLTKMEAGKMDYIFEEQAINHVISMAVQNTRSLAGQKEITLAEELAPDLPPIRIDRDRITQVLMNLLSNAVKFTDNGNTIYIRSRLTDPLPEHTANTITVEVEDTGIGIAPEHLSHVFSKFEQVENIDHHSTGTGLGMPICKQIVEEGHGGKIWIESQVNVGTKVLFQIPLN